MLSSGFPFDGKLKRSLSSNNNVAPFTHMDRIFYVYIKTEGLVVKAKCREYAGFYVCCSRGCDMIGKDNILCARIEANCV